MTLASMARTNAYVHQAILVPTVHLSSLPALPCHAKMVEDAPIMLTIATPASALGYLPARTVRRPSFPKTSAIVSLQIIYLHALKMLPVLLVGTTSPAPVTLNTPDLTALSILISCLLPTYRHVIPIPVCTVECALPRWTD